MLKRMLVLGDDILSELVDGSEVSVEELAIRLDARNELFLQFQGTGSMEAFVSSELQDLAQAVIQQNERLQQRLHPHLADIQQKLQQVQQSLRLHHKYHPQKPAARRGMVIDQQS